MLQNELLDPQMVVRHLLVATADLVYVRGIFEASGGVAAVFSKRGAALTVATFPSRLAELDQLLDDLQGELGHRCVLLTAGPEQDSSPSPS